MSLSSINFLHRTVAEKLPRQDFMGQGHYGKVKGQIKVTPWRCIFTPHNPFLYEVSTSCTLQFLIYSSDKIFKFITNVSNKYPLPKNTLQCLRYSPDKIFPTAHPPNHLPAHLATMGLRAVG